MKNRLYTLLLITVLSISAIACGGSDSQNKSTQEESESQTDEELSELEAIGDVEVDKNLFSVELTIPAEYVGDSTQDELNKIAEEKGFKSITLNEDGSATYIMTKNQHKEMLEELTAEFNSALSEMVGSEDYPNFTNIEANSDFTEFTITTTSTELGFNESFSVIAFYMYGGMYNAFNGTPVDNVHVDFVNAESGEIISSSDSKDMAEE